VTSPISPLLQPLMPAAKTAATSASSDAPNFSDLVDDAAADKTPAPAADKPTPSDTTAADKADAAPADKPDQADATKDDTAPAEQTPVAAADGDTATDADGDGKDDEDLGDLVDALAALDLNLQIGQPIDVALLDKLTAATNALTALVGGVGGVGAANGTPVDPNSMLGKLATKLEELSASLKATAPDLATKLDALATKLGSGEISAETLSKLGFDTQLKAADPAVAQVISTLVNTKTAAPKPTTQPFATPELKIGDTPALAPTEDLDATAALQPKIEAAKPDTGITQDKALEKVRDAANDMAKATSETGKDAPDTKVDGLTAATGAAAAARTELPATARVIHAAYQGPPSPINLPHMAFEIARQVHAGSNKFQIRLDPADLGRVDVSLDIDKNGTVNARMVVEKAETLDLMQRDQRQLEKALQQAGLDSSKTNLEFSLKQNSSGQQDGRNNGSPFGGAAGGDDDGIDVAPVNLYRGTSSASGVNIFV
jgi:flagellar hook-length control protein FliK